MKRRVPAEMSSSSFEHGSKLRAESQKLLEKVPSSKEAGLTPPAEGMWDIRKYTRHLPDFACYGGNPRNQGLVGVEGRNKRCVNKTIHMSPVE
ncbi:uncharacterized protein TNCV_4091451 [Trichonephila clavipes]|nr:uncharacterized protein TNCV_4091451 [Trichonephila clavipes]